MDRGTNRAQWEGEGGRGCEGRGGVEGGGPCCATCLVRTSILLRSDSPPPSLGPLGSRVRGRPLVLRGVGANLAWVGGALRTASREGRVASLASLGIVFPDPARPPDCPARLADKRANRATLPARVRQLPPATSRSASRSSPLAQIATSRARPGRPQRRHERADTKKLPREVSTGRARSVVALTARRHQALGPPRPERSQAPEPAGYSCRAARLHVLTG